MPPHYVAKARAILAENPGATGETIGLAIGTKASYGRRVRAAALEPVTA